MGRESVPTVTARSLESKAFPKSLRGCQRLTGQGPLAQAGDLWAAPVNTGLRGGTGGQGGKSSPCAPDSGGHPSQQREPGQGTTRDVSAHRERR